MCSKSNLRLILENQTVNFSIEDEKTRVLPLFLIEDFCECVCETEAGACSFEIRTDLKLDVADFWNYYYKFITLLLYSFFHFITINYIIKIQKHMDWAYSVKYSAHIFLLFFF